MTGSGTGPVVATYRLAAPSAAWRTSDSGRWSLDLAAQQVKGTDGFYMADGVLARMSLHVAKAPKPPEVKKVSLHNRSRYAGMSLAVHFSSDVGSTLAAADLVLTDAAGGVTPAASLAMTYIASKGTAVWTFPGLTNGALPAGVYHVRLVAAKIADAAGRLLDGNRDGVGGDDFVSSKGYRSKG